MARKGDIVVGRKGAAAAAAALGQKKATDCASSSSSSSADEAPTAEPDDLLQPTLGPTGWSCSVPRQDVLAAALLFVQHFCRGDWAAIRTMAKEPSEVISWQRQWKDLWPDGADQVRIDPDPVSFRLDTEPQTDVLGWVYVPLFDDKTEQLEALTVDIFSGAAEEIGNYDLAPLRELPGFEYSLATTAVPKTFKVQALDFGRP